MATENVNTSDTPRTRKPPDQDSVPTAITIQLEPELATQLSTFATQRGLTIDSVVTAMVRSQIVPAPGLQQSPDHGEFEDTRISRSVGPEERNRIADWVWLTQPVLGRFHLRLEGVEDTAPDARPTFVTARMEKRFIVSMAATALGTWLYGGLGSGRDKDKVSVNALKKQADAISAYILSEALFFSTRGLPENHALLVSLGEGWMPKAGETPEQGANPQIAFGRIFARPEVARFLQEQVGQLISGSNWEAFVDSIQQEHLTVWGAAIDTLENTSRFTRGDPSGPMVVLHVFNQPLTLTSPYECYMGALTVPQRVVEVAEKGSLAIHYLTPREKLLGAIREAYPAIPVRNIHVWTLGGPSRAKRLSKLWDEWKAIGVNLVDNGWSFAPNADGVFVDSGTYAPVHRVGVFEVDGEPHLFLTDGYASSAEAIQAASLDQDRKQRTLLCPFTPEFGESFDKEYRIMQLDANGDFTMLRRELSEILERSVSEAEAQKYNEILRAADRANMPRGRCTLTIEDFLPTKNWQCLAISAMILDDPYSGMPGIRKDGIRSYRVCVRVVRSGLDRKVTLTLGLDLPNEESRKAFTPLLDRLYTGEPYEERAIKSSDVGRILNELRTWCWNCVVDEDDGTVRVNLDCVDEVVIPTAKRRFILGMLNNYKRDYPSLAGHVILEGKLAAGG